MERRREAGRGGGVLRSGPWRPWSKKFVPPSSDPAPPRIAAPSSSDPPQDHNTAPPGYISTQGNGGKNLGPTTPRRSHLDAGMRVFALVTLPLEVRQATRDEWAGCQARMSTRAQPDRRGLLHPNHINALLLRSRSESHPAGLTGKRAHKPSPSPLPLSALFAVSV